MMPEFQMAGAWVEKPCLFRLPSEAGAAAACNHCNESFTFFNGRRFCDFCGYAFHRAESCIQKLRIDGELLRRRICSQCDFYRNVAGRKLCEGKKKSCVWSFKYVFLPIVFIIFLQVKDLLATGKEDQLRWPSLYQKKLDKYYSAGLHGVHGIP